MHTLIISSKFAKLYNHQHTPVWEHFHPSKMFLHVHLQPVSTPTLNLRQPWICFLSPQNYLFQIFYLLKFQLPPHLIYPVTAVGHNRNRLGITQVSNNSDWTNQMWLQLKFLKIKYLENAIFLRWPSVPLKWGACCLPVRRLSWSVCSLGKTFQTWGRMRKAWSLLEWGKLLELWAGSRES